MPKKSAVLQFVEDERAEGKTDKQIIHDLLDAGWEMDVIHYALEGETAHKPAEAPIRQPAKKTIPELLIHPYAIGGIFLIIVLLAIFV